MNKQLRRDHVMGVCCTRSSAAAPLWHTTKAPQFGQVRAQTVSASPALTGSRLPASGNQRWCSEKVSLSNESWSIDGDPGTAAEAQSLRRRQEIEYRNIVDLASVSHPYYHWLETVANGHKSDSRTGGVSRLGALWTEIDLVLSNNEVNAYEFPGYVCILIPYHKTSEHSDPSELPGLIALRTLPLKILSLAACSPIRAVIPLIYKPLLF